VWPDNVLVQGGSGRMLGELRIFLSLAHFAGFGIGSDCSDGIVSLVWRRYGKGNLPSVWPNGNAYSSAMLELVDWVEIYMPRLSSEFSPYLPRSRSCTLYMSRNIFGTLYFYLVKFEENSLLRRVMLRSTTISSSCL